MSAAPTDYRPLPELLRATATLLVALAFLALAADAVVQPHPDALCACECAP